ncbi:hypothetical protein NLG97_g5651 [Lecanicillium saksenae]|uniref:Uncharacterized protein n=1 Tax=Lecanicillium saksenae TaxID=468837 RepID=A0ACC1QV20_9HYPO|nr:hypothetical protein NLG97_g5651 [Lecanicillium saksenae]
MSQFLAVNEDDISLEDSVNATRINGFRAKMAALLHECIDISAVTALLSKVESGNSFAIGAAEYNGFYACIALSRHAFRWGVIPVVAAAQREQLINFPPELDLPWPYISRRYGVTSLGGNMMSNYFYNVCKGNVVYEINRKKDAHIRQAEYEFANIFATIELKAIPVYCDMIDAVIAFERGDAASCLRHMQSISKGISEPLKVFSETVVEHRISRTVWMPYVQGFQGWAAGEMIEGKYVEYDGLSGNQLPFFHMIDAFLGLEPYLTEENLQRYIPEAQRDLQILFRRHSFRARAQKRRQQQIETEMTSIIQRLRVGYRNDLE